MKLRVNNVKIFLDRELPLQKALSKKLGVAEEDIQNFVVLRRAVDARKKHDLCLNYHLLAEINISAKQGRRLLLDSDVNAYVGTSLPEPVTGKELLRGRVIVIGSGPAGLLAAVRLAKYGYKPLLLERGKNVVRRVADVQNFWNGGSFDPDSNVQFGEGGAGTFSDGKLTTRVNDPAMEEILKLFVEAGAPESILWEHKPHVGTDRLRAVVTGLSNKIRFLGGEISYDAHVTELLVDNGTLRGVRLASGETIEAGVVVLACGHSARDTYAMLHAKGIAVAAKPFAVGIRIEHPQELIDRAQYGDFAGHPLLGAADYALVHHTADKKRTAYSFCMCPGGQVVAAASEVGGVVVNGMSMYGRNSGLANSALVVNVGPDDYGSDPLAGVEFQRQLEKVAFSVGGGGYRAPGQNVETFLRQTTPSLQGLIAPSYKPDVKAASLGSILPSYVTSTLQEGLAAFGRKLIGFDDGGALLTGVETRTSAPVRIERRPDSLVSVNCDLLYPCGEGAGYAGGIMSAALDGRRVADKIIERFAPTV